MIPIGVRVSRPMPARVTTRAGSPPRLGNLGNADYTNTPFASRDSGWDDPLGADFSEGKADELEAEGKDPASCMFC